MRAINLLAIFDGILRRNRPVSYTHLDGAEQGAGQQKTDHGPFRPQARPAFAAGKTEQDGENQQQPLAERWRRPVDGGAQGAVEFGQVLPAGLVEGAAGDQVELRPGNEQRGQQNAGQADQAQFSNP